MPKTWSWTLLLNLTLTAAGLRAWLSLWPATSEDDSRNFELGDAVARVQVYYVP